MDKIIRAKAGDYIKMSLVNATDAVNRAAKIHGCSPTASAALGRALCAASLLGQEMKEENATVTIRINGGGPIGSLAAVSDHEGCVRGYVSNPEVELPLRSDGKLDVGGAVGRNGMLTVSRDIGLKEPYVGSTELVSGEIAEDLSAYLLESEQIPSACALGVLVDTDCSIKAAGGFIVQLMPGAPDDLIEKLEDNVTFMDQLTTILSEDGNEEVIRQVLRGFDYHIVAEHEMSYRCYCNRGRVLEALACIDESELREIIDEGKDIQVKCQFCDAVYDFKPADLRDILKKKEKI